MKRSLSFFLTMLVVLGASGVARADWRSLCYGGQQPWWNILGWGNKCCMTCEEKKLQRFWHDYYDAQRRYYCSLEHLDWVSYYKNHGQATGGACGLNGYGGGAYGQSCQAPIQFAPVTVAPSMGWAMPPSAMGPMGCAGGSCPAHGAAGVNPASYMPMTMFPGYGVPSMPSMPISPVGYQYQYGQ